MVRGARLFNGRKPDAYLDRARTPSMILRRRASSIGAATSPNFSHLSANQAISFGQRHYDFGCITTGETWPCAKIRRIYGKHLPLSEVSRGPLKTASFS